MTDTDIPIRVAAARAGGINPLIRQLGVTRQTFYLWEKEGCTAIYAILIARLTGVNPYTIVAPKHMHQLKLVHEYFRAE